MSANGISQNTQNGFPLAKYLKRAILTVFSLNILYVFLVFCLVEGFMLVTTVLTVIPYEFASTVGFVLIQPLRLINWLVGANLLLLAACILFRQHLSLLSWNRLNKAGLACTIVFYIIAGLVYFMQANYVPGEID